jgi:hypothetical protein
LSFIELLKNLEGILLEVDPLCAGYIDFKVLRIKIAVLRKESIPKARVILFYDEVTKDIRTYLLTYVVEISSQVSDPWGPSKN